jgi:hypothetical protein
VGKKDAVVAAGTGVFRFKLHHGNNNNNILKRLIYYRVLFRRVNHRQNATTAAHLT